MMAKKEKEGKKKERKEGERRKRGRREGSKAEKRKEENSSSSLSGCHPHSPGVGVLYNCLKYHRT